MFSITGIELGPDSCVLVRGRPRGAALEVSAVHQTERATWPAHDAARAAALRQLRKAKRFPRRARIVAWGLAPARERDQVARLLIAPVAAAGFRVERVITPPEALAEIARTRPRGRGVAVAWLAINVHGAAIAIVRDGELLHGRTFDWTYAGDARDPRGELLQRYSLVAHLAPELRQGMALARGTHGAIVEAAITCGDLPDLRSLTMPLIEELDLEVETLDSTEGLVARGLAISDRVAETAPGIRLAAAAVTIRPSTIGRAAAGPVARVAASAAIVAAAAWVGYRSWIDRGGAQSFSPPATQTARSVPAQGRGPTDGPSAALRETPLPQAPQAARPSAPRSKPPALESVPAPDRATLPPAGMTAALPNPVVPQPASPPAEGPPAASATPPLVTPPASPVRERAVDPLSQSADTSRTPLPLKAPVPSVESILVAPDRRVARIDGRIVTVGDQIGPRVVAAIERDIVVLEEPSGHQIQVRLRRRSAE